jgi:3-hydroxyisobutyrate dehydrogenase-like beta-hydroxyacid dehydrogenase
MHSEPIGIIGVGLVGTALAERLLAASYRVQAYDLRPEQVSALSLPLLAPDEIATHCPRIFLSLPTSPIAAEVIQQIRPALRPGSIVIDTTTGAPADSERAAALLQKAGMEYLDATIGGSSRQIRQGESIVLCGGQEHAFTSCTDLFTVCFRKAFHLGPAGSGARMKLVMNLVLGLHRAVLAEGLCFAQATGIDPARALEVLQQSPAYSTVMDTKGRKMIEENFHPEARLSQHLKDVRLILASGHAHGAKLPLSTVHRELLETAERMGFGGLDNSAVIKAFDSGRD